MEVKITDSDPGATLGDGEIGMIDVRGDSVFQGYWENSRKDGLRTARGWFAVNGDLGIEEADGRVLIVGRVKDLIIAGGYNIYPKEIESLLDYLIRSDQSALFGVPHPDFGVSVIAAIVPCGDELEMDLIKADLDLKLALFKKPRKYFVLANLPRNTMGKVKKRSYA